MEPGIVVGGPSKMELPDPKPTLGNTDLPVAALLTDVQQTGLLDETRVIWDGAFGRVGPNRERVSPQACRYAATRPQSCPWIRVLELSSI
jgi:hypothetical protein